MNSDKKDTRDVPLAGDWTLDDANHLESIISGISATPTRRKAMRSILAAVIVMHRGCPGRWLSYSRQKDFYSKRKSGPSWFTHARVTKAVDALEQHGLLEHDKAFPGRWGAQSRIRASEALKALISAGHVSVVAAETELIVLHDAKKRDARYVDTVETRRMRRDVERINAAARSHSIELDGVILREGEPLRWGSGPKESVGAVRLGLHRVFNQNFKLGGRFYGATYQLMSAEVRERLQFDGEPTVELDYPTYHPQLLYASIGAVVPNDAYEIIGFERPLAKMAFQAMINADNRLSAWRAVAKKIGGKGAFATAKDLLSALEAKHRPIAAAFYSGAGRIVQRIDSDIAERVILRMLDRGVYVAAIHDSFICPISRTTELQCEMDEALSQKLKHLRRNPIKWGSSEKTDLQNGPRTSSADGHVADALEDRGLDERASVHPFIFAMLQPSAQSLSFTDEALVDWRFQRVLFCSPNWQ